MGIHHAGCSCCDEYCELHATRANCTLLDINGVTSCGDGGVSPGCGPVSCTLDPPDVEGRTHIADLNTYPDGGTLFRWPKGTTLTVTIHEFEVECALDQVTYPFNSLAIRHGCPFDENSNNLTVTTVRVQTFVMPEVGTAPGCSPCAIDIIANYRECAATTLDCQDCLDTFGAFPMTLTVPNGYNLSAPYFLANGTTVPPGTDCAVVPPGGAKPLSQYATDCYEEALSRLPTSWPLHFGWCFGTVGGGHGGGDLIRTTFGVLTSDTHSDWYEGYPVAKTFCEEDAGGAQVVAGEAYLFGGFAGFIDVDPFYFDQGILWGRINVHAAVRGYATALIAPPFRLCTADARQGGDAWEPGPQAVDMGQLGTFGAGDACSYCEAIIDAIRNNSPYICTGEAAPGGGVSPPITIVIQ